MNSLATIQLVCFYLARVPSALNLQAYEQGLERTPFQARMLLMLPLRWAHDSSQLVHLAAAFSGTPGWFPGGVHPETIFEAVLDLFSVAVTGLVARSLYRESSRTHGGAAILTPLVYPLTLLMIACTYAGMTLHALRFVYDLPAMAFFSAAIWLIYFNWRPLWFCALFVVATINRETTLLLLPACMLARHASLATTLFPRTGKLRTLSVLAALAFYWLAWHLWVSRHFAGNASAAGPRFVLNLGTVLCPVAWPQLASVFAYLAPVAILFRRSIPDPCLRAWLWLLPLWVGFMMFLGLLIEIRIFGELIALLAASLTLIAETEISRIRQN